MKTRKICSGQKVFNKIALCRSVIKRPIDSSSASTKSGQTNDQTSTTS